MSTPEKNPTLVFIPCFAGAPWGAEELAPCGDVPGRTLRLPEGVDDMERYADYVENVVANLDDWVLVGDSFGANVALARGTRRPKGVCALVVSGGFAANPIDLPRTGHMFRFSHPVTYAAAVQDFLATVPTARQAARA